MTRIMTYWDGGSTTRPDSAAIIEVTTYDLSGDPLRERELIIFNPACFKPTGEFRPEVLEALRHYIKDL